MSAPHHSSKTQSSCQRRKPQRTTYQVLAGNPACRLAAQRGRESDMDWLNDDDQREENVIEDSDEESDSKLADDSDAEDLVGQGVLAEQLQLPTPVFASDDEEMEDCEEDSCEWEGNFDEEFDEWEEEIDESDDESLMEAASETDVSEEE